MAPASESNDAQDGFPTYKILVTGGAGYIGSTLVEMLLQRHHKVTVFDSFRFGAAGLFHLVHNENLTLINGDIMDTTQLSEAMLGQDVVYHLAGIVGFPACEKNPKLATDVNIQGTRNVINCLKPEQKIIFASTGSCYGAVEGICTEETELNPLTLYGTSKLEGENMVRAANGVALRLATLFGVAPRLRMDLLVNFFVLLGHSGENIKLYQSHYKRTFLHVKDACRAFVLAMDRFDEMKGQCFNVGDEKMNLTKLELTQLVQDCIPTLKYELCDDGEDLDQRNYEVSYKKIKSMGFTSKYSLKHGIQELHKVCMGMTQEDIDRAKNV